MLVANDRFVIGVVVHSFGYIIRHDFRRVTCNDHEDSTRQR